MKTHLRIRAAVIEIWASGRPYTTYTIAEATAGIGSRKAIAAKTVSAQLQRWALEGVANLQSNAQRQGKTAWRFAWGPEDATAADVLRLGFDRMSGAERRRLQTAMRHYFGLPHRTTSRAQVIEAGRAVPAHDLYGLPDRVAASAEQAGLARSTFQPWKSTLKAVLRLAAREEAVPVIFPRYHEEDAWEEACHEWFYHDHDDGTQPSTRRSYASTLLRARPVLREMGRDCSPSELSAVELEEEVYPHINGTLGRPSFANGLKTALRYVGRAHGAGPYRSLVGTARGHRPVGYLRTQQGEAGGFDTFLQVFRSHGFEEDVLEFLTWYRDYSRLPDMELWKADETDSRFPARPPGRHLTERTWTHRMAALRAFGYQAVELCQNNDVPLDMDSVFSRFGIQIARRMEVWWQKRCERKEVHSAHSKGIQQLLLHVGLAARAALDRELHQMSRRTVDGEGRPLKGHSLLEPAGELGARPLGYLRLYNHTRNRAAYFEKRRHQALGGHVHTDRKSIRRIYERTPPSYWAAINRRLQRTIKEWEGKRGYRYHLLVRNAFTHAFVMCTGCRGAETAWVRLCRGGGFGPENRRERRIDWEAWERKNNRSHSARLREALLPEWLEELYLEETRPYFLGRGIHRGKIEKDHDFLFLVPSTGASFSGGWWPSNEDERHGAADTVRKGVDGLRSSWRSAAAKAASELGMGWPTEYAEDGLHAIRNSMASGIYRDQGTEAAADYLGDSPDSVQDTYMAMDGLHVDPSKLDLDTVHLVSTAPNGHENHPPDGGPRDLEPGDDTGLAELRDENDRLRALIHALQTVAAGRSEEPGK